MTTNEKDDHYRLHQLALRERRKDLARIFHPKLKRPPNLDGLVSLSTLIFVLATRFLYPRMWSEHEVNEPTLGSETRWYFDYLAALERVIPLVQESLRTGRLTVRDFQSRSPRPANELRHWFELDIALVIKEFDKNFWQNPTPTMIGGKWLEGALFPAGALVSLDDVSAWAKAEDIASPDELIGLLHPDAGTEPLKNGEWPLPAPVLAPAPAILRDEAADTDDSAIANLFEPVKAAQLEAMFPDDGKWKNHTERAARNGLKKAAKEGVATYNPYRAAVWWLTTGPKNWTLEKCLQKLANNLPERSRDSKHFLVDY